MGVWNGKEKEGLREANRIKTYWLQRKTDLDTLFP